ncbi:hypothetical protein [Microbacterium sp.]|uniref:hypothetical protein n=1 Tax=Microbacterium sp. TaxID=51671 RepID=UPI003F70087F
MTEPEQPDTPPLTRKQLRDIRNTGATPVVTPTDADGPAEPAPEPESPFAPPPAASAPPLPRAAAPAVIAEPPVPDLAVDLGVSPLTRRQARQQERIRTASVPVITPDVIAAHTAPSVAAPDQAVEPETDQAVETETDQVIETPTEPAVVEPGEGDDTSTSALRGLFSDDEPDEDPYSEVEVVVVDEPSFEPVDDAEDEEDADAAADLFAKSDDAEVEQEPAERPVVNPAFGSALFSDDATQVDLPPSFDDLLARGSTGSVGTSSALILSSPTGESPIIAPVTATGEVLVTGTFNLPEGLGSLGHAPGAADGHEADAVLVDGELPAHSSPTPIAASAAISTVKTNGDVIKPPAPEKGSRLMMWLAITAGVLALALVGVLILAFVNGMF